MTKIFGIGWAKTGTTTLGNCFKILGFDHQSQDLGLVKDVQKGALSRIMTLAEKRKRLKTGLGLFFIRNLIELSLVADLS
jgi:hypothetical protein